MLVFGLWSFVTSYEQTHVRLMLQLEIKAVQTTTIIFKLEA